MAYVYQNQGGGEGAASQPSFHDIIQQQLTLQREEFQEYNRTQQETLAKRLSAISTPKIEERVKELKERRKREGEEEEASWLQGKERSSWVIHTLSLCSSQPGAHYHHWPCKT